MTPENAVKLAGEAALLTDKGLMLLFVGLLLAGGAVVAVVLWRFNLVTLKKIVDELSADRKNLAAEMKSDRKELGDIIQRNTIVVSENTRELSRRNEIK